MSETHSSSVPRGRPARPPPRPSSRRPRSPRAVLRRCARGAAPVAARARPPRTSATSPRSTSPGWSADVKPIFTTNLSDLEAAAAKVLSEAAGRSICSPGRAAPPPCARTRGRCHGVADRPADVHRPRRARPQHDRARRPDAGPGHPRPGAAPGPGAPRRRGWRPPARPRPWSSPTSTRRGRAPPSRRSPRPRPRARGGPASTGRTATAPTSALLRRARLAGCTHLLLSPPQPGQGWKPLAAIREAWDGPIVLGGIQTVPGRADGGPPRLRRHRRVERARPPRSTPRSGRSTSCRGSRTRSAAGSPSCSARGPHGHRRLPGARAGGRGRPDRPPVRASAWRWRGRRASATCSARSSPSSTSPSPSPGDAATASSVATPSRGSDDRLNSALRAGACRSPARVAAQVTSVAAGRSTSSCSSRPSGRRARRGP